MSSHQESGEAPPSSPRPDDALEQWRNNPKNMMEFIHKFGDEGEDSPRTGASSSAARRSTEGSAPHVASRPYLFLALHRFSLSLECVYMYLVSLSLSRTLPLWVSLSKKIGCAPPTTPHRIAPRAAHVLSSSLAGDAICPRENAATHSVISADFCPVQFISRN